MASRQHARVRLRLPVRLRWIVPLGQQTEICETRNVSKGGLLVACKEHHDAGFPLWVTFPFDASAPEQPEVLARVMRSRNAEGNGAGEEIALHFESVPLAARFAPEKTIEKAVPKPAAPPARPPEEKKENRNETATALGHKNGDLRKMALPIRVRPETIPWFEEAMTTEVSAQEIRFVSHREYLPGEILKVAFVAKDWRPWPGAGEAPAEVVKLDYLPKEAAMLVTLKRVAG